jgi:tetratricopeptide (TPR) repeat protein
MDLKEKLLDVLHKARAREQAFVEALSPAERAAEGSPADWSPKDLVAHMADWRLRKADDLGILARGGEPPDDPEYDAANQIIHQKHHAKSWEDVLRFSSEAWDALEKALEGHTEESLTAPRSMGGRPAWRLVVIDVGTHPTTHLAGYLLNHGRQDQATRWEQENASNLETLDASPAWRGTILYNLACHYALRSQPTKAIDSLVMALRLNPDLNEWSKQDSDLVSLRSRPDYEALYREGKG